METHTLLCHDTYSVLSTFQHHVCTLQIVSTLGLTYPARPWLSPRVKRTTVVLVHEVQRIPALLALDFISSDAGMLQACSSAPRTLCDRHLDRNQPHPLSLYEDWVDRLLARHGVQGGQPAPRDATEWSNADLVLQTSASIAGTPLASDLTADPFI